jgi:aldehyde:ferredoxin oxidoreductase
MKKTTTDNPIKELLFELGTNSQDITLDYLLKVNKLLLKYGVNLVTYGNVFNFLEYLEENHCVKIHKDETKNIFILTGLYNYGEII